MATVDGTPLGASSVTALLADIDALAAEDLDELGPSVDDARELAQTSDSLPAPVWLEPDGAFPSLRFDNSFVRELPGEAETLRAVRGVRGACFSPIAPVPVSAPRLVASSPEVARLLDLSEAACASDTFLQVFAGNALLAGMEPYAACYGGHQFGTWAGQLGDGRAISLGEVVNAAGQRWELQLKGAGATPYSRSADGRAVLRSSIREFLCSEAMAHLGVPTTRALSLVATGDRGRARHVLRRAPARRAGRDRLPRRPLVPALRQLRALRRARRGGAPDPARRLHAPASLPRARRAVARDLRRLADRDLPPHGRSSWRTGCGSASFTAS